MQPHGHYGVALLVWAPVGAALALAGRGGSAVVGGAVVLALSVLPDCDLQLPFLPHRGPTHTLPFALLVGAAVGALGWAVGATDVAASLVTTAGLPGHPWLAVLGFAAGAIAILSHLLADALTPMGVPLLWPASGHRYTVAVTRAANPLANYVLLGLGVGTTVAVVLALAQVA